jgi:hypothetical protein
MTYYLLFNIGNINFVTLKRTRIYIKHNIKNTYFNHV